MKKMKNLKIDAHLSCADQNFKQKSEHLYGIIKS